MLLAVRCLLFWVFILCLSYHSFGQALPEIVISEKATRKGFSFLAVKNHRMAIDFFDAYLKKNTESSDAYLGLGLAYAISPYKSRGPGYIEKSIALSKNPSLQQYLSLAIAYHLAHDFDRAAENYNKAKAKGYDYKQAAILARQCQYGKQYVAANTEIPINNMGSGINSAYSEYLPYITADQAKLFFTSRRASTTGGKTDENDGQFNEDIYVSLNKGGVWAKPNSLGNPINTAGHDACVGIAADGQTMFIYRGTGNGDIYISELDGNNWSKPKPFDYNTKEYFESSACLSADGRQLFFVSDRGGNKDIMLCRRSSSKAKWSKPVFLGNKINTPLDEEAPFLHSDGQSFYFSSKGFTSMGGYDIFKSTIRFNNGLVEPENLGFPINTAADDLYFILSADFRYGYYASEKEGGYGRQDLYVIKMPRPSGTVAILQGIVRNQQGKAVQANVVVTDNDANKQISSLQSNAQTGEYVVALPAGKNYNITIETETLLFHSENVQISESEGFKRIIKDIELKPIAAGSAIVLNNLFFDTNKSTIRPASVSELNRLISLLSKHPKMKVEISGHTDNVGNDANNQTLSESRAMAVKNYLVTKSIPAARLATKGFGKARPIADNNTAQGRQQNRRTEFLIISVK